MMGRRSWLGAMLAMTIPGLGGQTPQRPDQAYAGQQGQAVAPGSPNVVRARLVIVFGPTGAVNGVFIYQPGTAPGAGNGPVLSGTEAVKDPFGNTTQPGWVSYASPGSGSWAALINSMLQLMVAGAFAPAEVNSNVAGQLILDSGAATGADSQAAVQVNSSAASGLGVRLVQLVSDQVQLNVSASQNIPVPAVAGFPLPNDNNSGTGWVSGERAFMNNSWIAPVNALYNALVAAGIIV